MIGLYLSLAESEEEKQIIETLYNQNKQLMYNIAFKQLHNQYDAEDAVHEAFICAIKQIDRIKEISSNKRQAYLNIIVRNISCDIHNKNNNKVTLYENIVVSEEITIEDEIIGQIRHDALVEFIGYLPRGMRDALYLKYFLMMSNEEIEEALCISPSALRNRLFTARKKIRDYIDNQDNN